jgi:integrase
MPRDTEYTIEAVNARLKNARCKVTLFLRGKMLWAQATFPPKPGSDRPKPYQQALRLGVVASESGLRRAEREAQLIGAELAAGQFDWSKYMKADLLPENKPVKVWVREFEDWYLAIHDTSQKTWVGDWLSVFKRLNQDAPLTEAALMKVINSTERNTRTRIDVCRKLQELARFAKIDVDLLQYKGNYGASKVEDRDIPTDEEIAYWWGQIKNPAWQWAYGVMAAYGLRDHELFFCEWTDGGLFVTKGKTGARFVFQALYPEWMEQWELQNIMTPPSKDIEGIYDRGKLGDKVARQFRRYNIPFKPYDLRHAYGIRASVTFGLDVTTSAMLMGHSPEVHLKRYHKHIKTKQGQDAAQRIMQRPDRPLPPTPML